MKTTELVKILDEIFPPEKACEGDNSGLNAEGDREVEGIYTCLDINREVLADAEKQGCNFIVCHHPVLFFPTNKITAKNNTLLISAMRKGISIYAAHTPADIMEGGINDKLFRMLGGGIVSKMLCPDGIGRVGAMTGPSTLSALSAKAKAELQDNHIKTIGSPNTIITKIAVIGGAGGGDAVNLEYAKEAGAEVLITGDIKHHVACYSRELGMSMISVGHYESEVIFAGIAYELINKKLNGKIKVVLSKLNTNPFN